MAESKKYIDEIGGEYLASETMKRAVSVELTQAEYDALDENEKNSNTVYYIKDGSSIGGTGVSQEKLQEAVKTLVESGVVDLSAYFKNDLITEEEGFALDARQGKILNDKIESIDTTIPTQNNLTTEDEGYVLDARQGKVLDEKIAALGTNEVAKINGVEVKGDLTLKQLGIYTFTKDSSGLPYSEVKSNTLFEIMNNATYGQYKNDIEVLSDYSFLPNTTQRCGGLAEINLILRVKQNFTASNPSSSTGYMYFVNTKGLTNYTTFSTGFAYRNYFNTTPSNGKKDIYLAECGENYLRILLPTTDSCSFVKDEIIFVHIVGRAALGRLYNY